MKLRECKDWKALHLNDRTILKSDLKIYPKMIQEMILNAVVEPADSKGHYKAI